jgi:3-phenylpropionate/cinnamic acid dioxygenase small subunit
MGDDGEIRSLIARLAYLADTGTLDEYIENIAEDARWQMPDNQVVQGSVRSGHKEILAGVRERREAGVQGPGTFTRHLITSIEVHLADDVTATTRSMWSYYRQTNAEPTLTMMGQYDDEYRKLSGRWKLAHRVISLG